jgi:outer membrane protein OmpA-like peptidoglycan-associated protein
VFAAAQQGAPAAAKPAPAASKPASLDAQPATAAATGPVPGDLPNARDPAGFQRFAGSQIIHYTTRAYDQYVLYVNNGTPPPLTVEGEITRIFYKVPEGHTALELGRNYDEMLTNLGFQIEPARLVTNTMSGVIAVLFQQVDKSNYLVLNTQNPSYYTTAKGSIDGREAYVSVYSIETSGGSFSEPNDLSRQIPFKPNQVLVALDVVKTKAFASNLVTVSASDMADALATKGSVDIYGILFDVDKTDIKPESKKTLDEVASLLKIDRSLKLEVAGHTDNTGSAEHNMTLSDGRAAAVVQALVKTYGIDPARLQAKGYGDSKPVAPNDTDAGRAKNRRVELRKL